MRSSGSFSADYDEPLILYYFCRLCSGSMWIAAYFIKNLPPYERDFSLKDPLIDHKHRSNQYEFSCLRHTLPHLTIRRQDWRRNQLDGCFFRPTRHHVRREPTPPLPHGVVSQRHCVIQRKVRSMHIHTVSKLVLTLSHSALSHLVTELLKNRVGRYQPIL